MTIVQTDTAFNVQWVKTFDINEDRNIVVRDVLKDGFGYYIIGQIVDENIPGFYSPLFVRVNSVGDTIRTSITEGFDGDRPVHSAIFNSDRLTNSLQ